MCIWNIEKENRHCKFCSVEHCTDRNENKKFEELAKPLMEYLHKNFHPHTQIIINWDGAEVVEGKIGISYSERS